ncbi:MAG: chalcone isomerase family protein [Halioglobus sp.]
MKPYSVILPGRKRPGARRSGKTRLGQNRLDQTRLGRNWLGRNWLGQKRLGQKWLVVTKLLASLVLLSAIISPARAMELQKVGEASLKVFVWPVYNSRLYSADGNYVAGQRPVRLDIEYLRDVDAEDLVAHTREEWQHQGVTHEEQPRWLARLAQLWPDVAKGDILSVVVDDSNVSTFYRNGERLGALDDPDFGQHFLGIWLSPDTSRPELRLALLGKR